MHAGLKACHHAARPFHEPLPANREGKRHVDPPELGRCRLGEHRFEERGQQRLLKVRRPEAIGAKVGAVARRVREVERLMNQPLADQVLERLRDLI